MSHRLARLDDFSIGQTASFAKTISAADIEAFAGLTGDRNPLHVDEEFARSTFFGSSIAHGMLSGSLLSTVIGCLLPGTGAIYRSQNLRFLRPVHAGDTLRATVAVREISSEHGQLGLDTWIENQDGVRVIEGEAVVSMLRGLRAPAR
jgi:3-hydroxybutyryl-CoA dehydratase